MKPTSTQAKIMKTTVVLFCSLLFFMANTAQAQSIKDVRWKSSSEVRSVLGEPLSISSPTGTHATYTMWKYATFTVAFSNDRAFHLFQNDSLRKIKLQENR